LAGLNAVLQVSTTNAVYKGVSQSRDGRLYVANFASGFVEVYNSLWNLQSSFTDMSLKTINYHPFNVAVLHGFVYVSFALIDGAGKDDVAGLGNGYVDIFSLEGKFLKRLIDRGALNSPWAMLDYKHENKRCLLVGNFGDGKLNLFSSHGDFIRTQHHAIDGLWGVVEDFNLHKLYFTAGINKENDGLFGRWE